MSAHRTWWTPVVAWPEAGDEAAGPLAARLFSEDLVLWRGAGSAPVAWLDRCPHRGAKLSLGRVRGGELQCPYHGWRFSDTGRCVAVPALPGFVPPEGNGPQVVAARPAHGLLWVALDAAADATDALRAPPPLDGLPARRVLCGPFDVATSAPRVVENFLDTAHFAFVHEGWLGSAEMPTVPHHDVRPDEAGRPVVHGYPAWQPRAQAAASEGGWVRYDYRVLGPYSACLLKSPDATGASAEAYVLWTCPLDEEQTRVWFTIATEDRNIDASTLIAFQQQIFAQDQPVLESQRPRRLPLNPEAERHVASDRLSMAYRRWLQQIGVRFGTC